MNNKGYTLLEMIIILMTASLLLYSIIYIPTDLLKEHTEYSIEAMNSSDLYLLRTAIIEDLKYGGFKYLNDETVLIGNSKYIFNDKVVRHNDNGIITLTTTPYQFELDKIKNSIKIFNSNQVNLEYSANNSFTKNGGDNIE